MLKEKVSFIYAKENTIKNNPYWTIDTSLQILKIFLKLFVEYFLLYLIKKYSKKKKTFDDEILKDKENSSASQLMQQLIHKRIIF